MPLCALTEPLRTIDAGFAKTGKRARIRKKRPFNLNVKERLNASKSNRSMGRVSTMPVLIKMIFRVSR
jgi:hypothetical protein